MKDARCLKKGESFEHLKKMNFSFLEKAMTS